MEHEVVEALKNKPKFRFVENGHILGENLYAALSRTYAGRYLIVFFIYKKTREALIVSARNMTDSERSRYERK